MGYESKNELIAGFFLWPHKNLLMFFQVIIEYCPSHLFLWEKLIVMKKLIGFKILLCLMSIDEHFLLF